MPRAILLFLLVATAVAEDATLNWVVFSRPVYPQMARIANIQGQVTLEITVNPDGAVTIQKATGHPILIEAAKDSVLHSTLVCEGCGGESHTFPVTYDFKLDNPPPPAPSAPVRARPLRRVRSIRCMYLWRCAVI
jgi:TonB family protein